MSRMSSLEHPPRSHGGARRLGKPGNQCGASLIELLTGIVVGLLVTLAALGTLLFMQLSSATKDDAFRLQERADVALRAIGGQLRQAGAIELQQTVAGNAVTFSRAFDGFGGSGHAVEGDRGTGTQGDTLRVSHQDNATARDCLGNQPDAAQAGIRIDSRFFVASGELRCAGANSKAGAQAVVDHVEDFRVSYGVREAGASGTQYRVVNADQVGMQWGDVQAVLVCLQVSGERRAETQSPAAGDFGCSGQRIPMDGTTRHVVRATFSLRNAVPRDF